MLAAIAAIVPEPSATLYCEARMDDWTHEVQRKVLMIQRNATVEVFAGRSRKTFQVERAILASEQPCEVPCGWSEATAVSVRGLYGVALFWASRSASCAKLANVVETESEHEFAPPASIGHQTHLQALDVDRKDRGEECEFEKVVDNEDDRAEANPFSHDLSKPASEKDRTQVDTSHEANSP